MDREIQKKLTPNYSQIYKDLIQAKFPEKWEECSSILLKEELTALEVLKLNNKLFGGKKSSLSSSNPKHKSYDIATIKEILSYQSKNNLNNTQIADHFKLSRNTIAKWKSLILSGI